MQADPIGWEGGWNRYAYVGGNPLSYINPYGLVRWGDVATNTVGLFGSGAGIVLGGVLISAPTGVSQAVGGVVLVKSVHSWGTGWYGLTRAFSDDASYDIPSRYQTLPRTIATNLSCSPNAESYADAAELALDFASGRVIAGDIPNPSGWMRASVGYPQRDASYFTHSATYDEMISPAARNARDALQFFQTIQYGQQAISR